jgi:hypothetical protein
MCASPLFFRCDRKPTTSSVTESTVGDEDGFTGAIIAAT